MSSGSEPGAGVDGSTENGTLQSLQAVAGSSMLSTGPETAFWSWNGDRWTKITASNVQPPQTWANMQAADGADVILFGGSDLPNGPNTAETWLWGGSQWRRVVTAGYPAPTPTTRPPTQNPNVVTPAAP